MIGCLCIHGFTGGSYEVEPLAMYLKEKTDWNIVAPSLPGHGEELQLKSVTYEEWIATCEEELERLSRSCDQLYLIGFSMGGMIAAYLAAKYNVSKLVLLSPSRKYISVKQMAMDITTIFREGITGELKDDEVFQRYVHKKGSVPLRSMVEFIKCMRFTKSSLHGVTCPVFIAQGIQDGMVPYQAARELDEEIPAKTEVVFFYDSKHHICLGADKEIVFEKVYAFLSAS
ncbi:alpha/beta hydrolase [Aquibacillus sediminis]|uniref:alpha/beta hydrolase n=1 Tax=Aquibacillus sediminis TaxID=2574734 RepID=UPI001109F176|nr:alpha/beta fold hydrolase [Aquibacillus sediminis]